MTGAMLFQTLANGLMLAFLYMLIAIGLTLIFGIMNIVNFAHGELLMLGAFAAFYFFGMWGVNYFATLLIAMMLVGFLGILIERGLLRHFQAKPLGSVIVTVGLLMVLQTAATLVFGPLDKPVPSAFHGIARFLGVVITHQRLATIVFSVALIGGLYLFLQRTKTGRAMRATTQDNEAAVLQGIDVGRIRSLGMFVGCALAAAAGVFMGPIFYINPFMGLPPLLKAFAVVIIGGLGSIPGAIVGGLIIGFIESFGSTFVDPLMASVMSFAILILVLVIRPSGLWGHAE